MSSVGATFSQVGQLEYIHIFLAGLTAVILFVFGLQNFSTEIERISGERSRRFLARATRIPAIGVLIGAVVTGLIKPFTRLIDLLLGEEKRDFERLPLPVFEEDTPHEQIRADLRANRNDLLEFL